MRNYKNLGTFSNLFFLWTLGRLVKPDTDTFSPKTAESRQKANNYNLNSSKSTNHDILAIKMDVNIFLAEEKTLYDILADVYFSPAGQNTPHYFRSGETSKIKVERNSVLGKGDVLNIDIFSGKNIYELSTLDKRCAIDTIGYNRVNALLTGSMAFSEGDYAGTMLTVDGKTDILVDSYGSNRHFAGAVGIIASGQGLLEFKDLAVVKVNAAGDNSTGIVALAGSNIKAEDTFIKVKASATNHNYTPEHFFPEQSLYNEAPAAIGIFATSTCGGRFPYVDTEININGKAHVNVTGDKAIGLEAVNEGSILVKKKLDIYALATKSLKTAAIKRLIESAENKKLTSQAIGISAQQNSLVNLTGEVTIHKLEGEEKIGIYAESGGTVVANCGFKAIGLSTNHFNPTKINSLFATGYNTRILIRSKVGHINRLCGSIIAEKSAVIRVHLHSADSGFLGNIAARYDEKGKPSGQVHLSLKAGARWINLFDSNLTTLHLENAVVSMIEKNYNEQPYQKLMLDSLTGNKGIFRLDTNLKAKDISIPSTWSGNSDQIIITNKIKGTCGQALLDLKAISFKDGWSYEENQGLYKLLLIIDYSKKAAFTTLEIDAGGLYYYLPELSLEKDADAHRWYLTNFIKTQHKTARGMLLKEQTDS